MSRVDQGYSLRDQLPKASLCWNQCNQVAFAIGCPTGSKKPLVSDISFPLQFNEKVFIKLAEAYELNANTFHAYCDINSKACLVL
jgi:hypothetical protein